MIHRPDWDSYFMLLAKLAAVRSTCLSRPTGAIIVKDKQVISTGYNGSLPNQPHCSELEECLSRTQPADVKYTLCRSAHAEANAIALAARHGITVDGATVYCTLQPCLNCTKLLTMSGIARVVYELPYASADPAADKFWRDTLDSCNIEHTQLVLAPKEITSALFVLKNITSTRRLG